MKRERDDAINMIIASIAMEKLSIAHILNAAGEKIQYVLGTLEENKLNEVAICDIMADNNSIQKTLGNAIKAKCSFSLTFKDVIELDDNGDD